jgi:DNA-binding transcriptional LysR family regulator
MAEPHPAERYRSLVVRFVPGVTPGKWERAWRERVRHPLSLEMTSQDDALGALMDGTSHMAFLRDFERTDDLHAIQLYREQPVVVAPKDSVVAAFDSLTLEDLSGEVVLEGQDADTVELVAANVGVALMPMSVARLLARKDVVARPITDADDTGIALVWPVDAPHPLADDFIGIVRGRSANSSR